MPRRCRNPGCRWKIIEFPIWKGQEHGESFAFNKILWRNLLIGDWTKLMILITLIFVAWSYGHDSAVYREIYTNPCDYIKNNIDACLELEKQDKPMYITPDLRIEKINFTDPGK